MDADQVQQLRALFDRTDQASRQSRQSMKSLYSRDADANEANTAAVAAARVLNLSASEVKAANRIITHEQRKRFQAALGTKRDTSKFDRVYAQAPELIDSGQWYQDRKTTLQAHRGKVILLHFYAFQCHNCHANFPIYNRWQEKLMEKGAVVIGIKLQKPAPNRSQIVSLRLLRRTNLTFLSCMIWRRKTGTCGATMSGLRFM